MMNAKTHQFFDDPKRIMAHFNINLPATTRAITPPEAAVLLPVLRCDRAENTDCVCERTLSSCFVATEAWGASPKPFLIRRRCTAAGVATRTSLVATIFQAKYAERA